MKRSGRLVARAALLPRLLAAALLADASLPAQALQAAAPAGAEALAAPDAEAVQAGRGLYTRNCSHCHGFNMVNPGTVSFDLRKFPTEDPDRFYRSVKEGKGAMPAWKNSLSDDQIRQIWAYVQAGHKP